MVQLCDLTSYTLSDSKFAPRFIDYDLVTRVTAAGGKKKKVSVYKRTESRDLVWFL